MSTAVYEWHYTRQMLHIRLMEAGGINHQEELRVYGRGGLPCLACGTVLRRTVVAGRATTYCPVCQR